MSKIVPDGLYINNIKEISFRPVFILGLHRSGTSILYKMLTLTQSFNYVTAYHLLKYEELLYNHIKNREQQSKKQLENLFAKRGIDERKIDHLKVTPDFPEEYGFLLTKLKYPCKLDDNNINILFTLCKKIQCISKNDKSILLKNPYDFPNFIYIKEKIPNAKFIFIHRNPIDVINSTANAWEVLIKNKNPYTALLSNRYEKDFKNPFLHFISKIYYLSPRSPLVVLDTLKRSQKAVSYYLNNIGNLSQEDYISLKYEDLCMEPNNVMNEIMHFLESEKKYDFTNYIKFRHLDLSPKVKKREKVILNKMSEYNKKFGY